MEGRRADVFESVEARDRDAVEALLRGDPTLASSVNDDGMPLLHAAAQTDDPELVEAVLAGGAERDARAEWGHTALQWAANMNARRAAALLLKRGSSLDLWTAAALGKVDEVRALLDAAAGPEAEAAAAPISDAFYIACRNGALEVARLLRSHGAEVDALGYFDATALHWAAINGHGAVVEWLVEEGADVRRRDPKFNATPEGWAREGGHHELARWLEDPCRRRGTASDQGGASGEGGASAAGEESQ